MLNLHLVLFMASVFLISCQFNASLTDLNKKSAESTQAPALTIDPSSKSIVIGQSISFAAYGGSGKYSYTITQGAGQINASTGAFVAGQVAETVKIQVTDSLLLTAEATIEIQPPLSMSATPYDVYAGSQYSFTLPLPTGGVPNFQYSLFSGLGAVTGNQYSPGLVAGTAVVKIADQANGTANLNLKIRLFEEKQRIDSAATSSAVPGIVYDLLEVGSEVFALTSWTPPSSGTFGDEAKESILSIFKTSDNGSTWTFVSNYQFREDRQSNSSRLLKNGSKLYITGYSKRYYVTTLGNYYYESFIAESNDSGVTWTTKSTYRDPSNITTIIEDAIITTDNAIVVIGGTDTWESKFIRKCDLTTWVCNNVFYSTSDDMNKANELKAIAKDASGNLYVIHRKYNSGSSANELRLLKSTDQGSTWNIASTVAHSDIIKHMAISGDGQTIALAGTVSANPAVSIVSYNGGTTWTRLTGANVCGTGWHMSSVVIDDISRAILGVCYDPFVANTYKIYRLTYLAGSWTNRLNLAGPIPLGYILKKSDGTLIIPNSTNIRITSDFGTTFSSANSPSKTVTTDAELAGIVQAGVATLFSVGYLGTSTVAQRKGVIYKSTDSGTSWTADYTSSNTGSTIMGITRSPTTGTLIAVGRVDNTKWTTYRNSSGTWSVVETETFSPAAFYAHPTAAFAGANGKMYTVGRYANSNGYFWYVKTSIDDGLTWTMSDNFLYNSTFPAYARAGIAEGPNVWVVGHGREALDSTAPHHWLVRKFDGTIWTTDDDFAISPSVGVYSKAADIIKASDGTLYVVGEYTKLDAYRIWVVRRKLPTIGATWETVDEFQLAPNMHSAAMKITEAADGRLYVSGISESSDGAQKMTVRVLLKEGWKTVDRSGTYGISTPNAMIPCFTNQLCIAGTTYTSDWLFRGVVRILSP